MRTRAMTGDDGRLDFPAALFLHAMLDSLKSEAKHEGGFPDIFCSSVLKHIRKLMIPAAWPAKTCLLSRVCPVQIK
jgi:hypothetical protein